MRSVGPAGREARARKPRRSPLSRILRRYAGQRQQTPVAQAPAPGPRPRRGQVCRSLDPLLIVDDLVDGAGVAVKPLADLDIALARSPGGADRPDHGPIPTHVRVLLAKGAMRAGLLGRKGFGDRKAGSH